MKRLRLKDFVPEGAHYNVARARVGLGSKPHLHTHDFAEIFWIEAGRGYHLVNGQRVPLNTGHCCLVRSHDRHGFASKGADPMTQVNLAFESTVLEACLDRLGLEPRWSWQQAPLPPTFELNDQQREELMRQADRLFRVPLRQQSQLQLERMLITLLDELDRPQGPAVLDDLPMNALPTWLADAIYELWRDARLRLDGVPGLAAFTGRSESHISRLVRQHLNMTTTDLINRVRLNCAAAELRLSDRPLLDIAVDAGLPNLSYFHRLFLKHYGTTPRRYRVRQQQIIRGTDR